MHISKLKKYYFIDDFNPIHLKDLDKNIILIWRSKNKINNFKEIHRLAIFCKKNKIKLILSNNVKLALKLKLNGAYISAHNREFRFISDDSEVNASRLVLLQALSIVIKNGMSILGVSTPKSM